MRPLKISPWRCLEPQREITWRWSPQCTEKCHMQKLDYLMKMPCTRWTPKIKTASWKVRQQLPPVPLGIVSQWTITTRLKTVTFPAIMTCHQSGNIPRLRKQSAKRDEGLKKFSWQLLLAPPGTSSLMLTVEFWDLVICWHDIGNLWSLLFFFFFCLQWLLDFFDILVLKPGTKQTDFKWIFTVNDCKYVNIDLWLLETGLCRSWRKTFMKVSTTFYGKETAIVNLRRRERNQSLGLLVHDFDFIESEWIFQELQLYVNKVRLLSLKSDLDLFSNKKKM